MDMTFGEKLKKARAEAGYTQEELASMLAVSRAAIAKWESGRGMPDIANLKAIAETLGTSVDYLLDDGRALDLSETKKAIDLGCFGDTGKLSRLKKLEIKERIVRQEYPDAELVRLTLTGVKNTKRETVADQAIGWFSLLVGGIPLFDTQELGKMANSLDEQYYLVNMPKGQYFILMTDEHMVSRALANRITADKFEIGGKEFRTMGTVA